ncbi:hypothetical protein ACIA8G_30925 [Lentzea sp. NPDC051213]|uniref:hypothetical protein n=1 Tax=Lentzea sp. NPDC051213 TaxID=3364126 RepID=UPI0037B46054
MSEQGQAPPPPEPGAQKNEPQAAQPAPDQATTPLPADAPATPGQQPTAEQPAATSAEAPAAPATETSTAAEAPAAAPVPPAAAPVAAVPAGPGRVRRIAGHRATQLVAVGLLGLVLGGGIVGAIAANRFDDRPGHVRMYERGGPDRGDRGGDRFEQRGPFNDRGDRFER